jgi:hypothetical protein
MRTRGTGAALLGAGLIVALLPLVGGGVADADPLDVVINELMYHPPSDVDGDDYIELHNPTAEPVDAGGWCFTAGITGCLPEGTTIPPAGFLVVAKNPGMASTTYGVAITLGYGGNLSNSGETVTVLDSGGAEVDSVTYSDVPPWPAAPDGSGPSLERRHPSLPSGEVTTWAAAAAASGHSAGAQNSVFGIPVGPPIGDLTLPSPAPAGTPIVVSVLSPAAETVSLEVVVDHEVPTTEPMADDGVGDDVEAGDGRFTATLAGQPAETLLRVRATASAGGADTTLPAADDSQAYRGVVVGAEDGDGLPVMRLFMADGAYEEMVTDHAFDDQTFPAVLAMGGQVFDSATVRVRGGYSRNYPRKSLKVELPAGYELTVPGVLDEPVDELALTGDWYDWSYVRLPPVWDLFHEEGFPENQVFKVRVDLDGSLLGAYTFIETYDGMWRDRNGYDDGAFYEGLTDKKTREDEGTADIEELEAGLTSPDPVVRRATIYDQVDIPSWVNFAALNVLVRRHDWTAENNMIYYRDTEGTGRWSTLPWDLDALTVVCCDGIGDYVHPFEAEEDGHDQDLVVSALMDQPEMRAMFFRRLRDLADEHLATGALEAAVRAEHTAALPDLEASFVVWIDEHQAWIDQLIEGGHAPEGSVPIPPTGADLGAGGPVDAIWQQTANLLEDHVGPGELPPVAGDGSDVVISEVHHVASEGDDHDFLELHNAGGEAVDLSGWTVEGVETELPRGTVLPADGYLVLAADDPTLRADTGGGLFIPAQLGGVLEPGGELLVLRDGDGTEVDRVRYDDGVPWPQLPPDRSLSRIDPSDPETGFAAWAPSTAAGGTPGAANDPSPGTTLPVTFPDVTAGHPFFEEIAWMADQEITTGFADGTFRSAQPVSRQALAAFLHRLAGSPAPAPDAPTFSDVPPAHPFAAAISWLAGTGAALGNADGTFRPARPVSRQALAAFLHRLAGSPAPLPGAPGFSDVGPDHPFRTPIGWLAGSGITEGYADGTFRPAVAVSRQAAAVFLYRRSLLEL